jgi:hypothetical protein
MAKIENVKNDHIDFDVFGSANVFLLFEKKFKKSLVDHIGSNPNDVEALSNALYFGHVSFCKLFGKDQVIDSPEYICERMDINEIAGAVMEMLGFKVAEEPKKK